MHAQPMPRKSLPSTHKQAVSFKPIQTPFKAGVHATPLIPPMGVEHPPLGAGCTPKKAFGRRPKQPREIPERRRTMSRL